MRFELKGRIRFSKSVEELAGELGKILDVSKPILTKGAPIGREEEACRLEEWELKGENLMVKLVSGRYVRAHDGLLRLAKKCGEELGKFRIGVREVFVDEYRIFIPSAKLEKLPASLRSLPCELKRTVEGIELYIRGLSEKDLRDRVVDRLISVIQIEPSKPVSPVVVREGGPMKITFKEDPCEMACRLGWLREFPGRGQWILLGTLASLQKTMEDLIVENVALPLGFQECMLPKLIPLQVMQKMPGYLDTIPEGMFYVCPPPRDPAAFEEFKAKLKLTKKLPVEELEKVIKHPSYVLAPAQCEPFYEMFSSKTVRLEDLPVKLFDRSGWTYRWEGGGVEGLLRTQEFRRVELVFLAEPKEVVKIRDEVLERAVKLAEELRLRWRILEATPFYLREGVEKSGTTVATYDLEIYLPYKDDWTEVGSYNVHMDKFVKSFRIKEAKNREIWTGCCGFGSSRWTVAFLAQHGLEREKWPEIVKERVKEVPKVPRIIE
jgi:seryl-tRNA synthetase